ncbi:MAG: hypothetical protein K2X50_05030 [Gammaproteobacteria bacterium]|nr:hypothetical protein [Gammaproteobacteria bacterium]
MSKSSKAELIGLKSTCLINNAHNLLASVHKAEFQHLRTEFEKILDDYLEKSTQVTEEDMPGLIHDTTWNFAVMLKKAAKFTRNQE